MTKMQHSIHQMPDGGIWFDGAHLYEVDDVIDLDEHRRLRAERGLKCFSETLRQSKLPGHQHSIFLRSARGCRVAADGHFHPGRWWWLLQWAECMRKAKAARILPA